MAKIREHNGIRYIRVSPWWHFNKIYKNLRTYAIDVKMRPDVTIRWGKHCALAPNGVLTIKAGFLFGPSGPTLDTDNSMRGALVHDALYGALRSRKLLGRFNSYRNPTLMSHEDLRRLADQWLWKIVQEDGMSRFRADRWYDGLRFGGASSAKPKGESKALSGALLKNS